MTVLNSWQKLSRITTTQDYGDGKDGDYSSATIPTMVYGAISGSNSSGQATLNLTSAGSFVNGDFILIHQSRGTGVGQWEVNKIIGGGGTTVLTLLKNLQYTYQTSGNNLAQIVRIPRYRTVTVPSGTWQTPNWTQSSGGITIIAANVSIQVTGTISAAGVPGQQSTSTVAGVQGCGFIGGQGGGSSTWGYQGEGSVGIGGQSRSANGTGGGGNFIWGGGAGGGYASGGSGGGGNPSGSTGGGTAGSGDGTNMMFGGGGGGGSDNNGNRIRSGSTGGGMVILLSPSITISGAITVSGGNAYTDGNNSNSAGGAAAGGHVLLVGDTVSMGTNLVSAGGGSAVSIGGAGGTGYVSAHYKTSITGSVSLGSLTSTQDTSLLNIPPAGGAFALFV